LLKHDFPFVKIPSTVAPRAGLPQLVAALAHVLQQLGVNNQLVPETIDTGRELQRLQGRYGVETLTYQNPAKLLARKLENADLVVTYALDRMSAVARRFKNQLAENSKVLSKYAVLPEAGHNEVEAWRKVHKNILPLVLRDSVENRSETNFMQAFESTIKYGSRIVPIKIRVPAKSSLARLLAPIFFLDYVSVYLAVLRGVDPTPNPMISQYKKRLKE
jgi:glucose/mannose-6-phosphate isomerase